MLGNSKTISPKPVFKQFTVDDGLASNEVYHLYQDSVGFIWIATAAGVSRFDGTTFTNYGPEDGLIENTIYEIYCDYKGRLWFISSNGRLVFFENEKIHPYPFNYKIGEHLPTSRGPVKLSFLVDSLDNIDLSLKQYGRVKISKDGAYQRVMGIHQEGQLVFEKTSQGKVLISNPLKAPTFDMVFLTDGQVHRYSGVDLFEKTRFSFHYFSIYEGENTFLSALHGFLIRMKDGKVLQKRMISEDIIWANVDDSKNLWAATLTGGVYCFENADFMGTPKYFLLENLRITSVLRDREGGYWISTLTEGVFYYPNIQVSIYGNDVLPFERVSAVYTNEKGIYVGYESGILSHIRSNRLDNYTLADEKHTKTSVRFIIPDATSSNIWIGTNLFLHSYNGMDITNYLYSNNTFGYHTREMFRSFDGNYWVATAYGIRKFDGKETIYHSKNANEFSGAVNTICEDSKGIVWFGCNNGLWSYHQGFYEYLGNENPFFSKSISSIAIDLDGSLLLATRGFGLIVKSNSGIMQLTRSEGLISDHIKKVLVDKSGVWLSTNHGISWFKREKGKINEIHNFTTADGLPTNDINGIYIKEDQVYVATSKGIAVFNLNTIKGNATKPNCKIVSVRVNNFETNITKGELTLDYTQNFLIFEYVGLAFKNMDRLEYRYRLLGLDSSWVYTRTTKSIFSGLEPKTYRFEVQTMNSNNLWGDSAILSFTIRPPFWKTLWFSSLLTLALTLGLYLVYLSRIRSIRRRNELVNSINLYKQQSLRQQMNPHFIFNTLNSIQMYILEKDKFSSQKYLGKFSKLIRMTLDNSLEQTIPLKDEIEALKLYLELEALRLEGKLEYSIEVEDDSLLQQHVPTLLFQPFVENSIWHGIMLKAERHGWVRIRFAKDNGTIICTIEDNGVGVKAANLIHERHKSEHKSLGYKITKERISILNTIYSKNFSITYFDISEEDEKATGTRVRIVVPVKNQGEMG